MSMNSDLRTEDIIINNLNIKFATDDKNFKTMFWFDNNIKNRVLMPYDFTDTEMKRILIRRNLSDSFSKTFLI
ncbi:MAG: hypothetical protein ACI8WT_001282 [Clostridium sp.]